MRRLDWTVVLALAMLAGSAAPVHSWAIPLGLVFGGCLVMSRTSLRVLAAASVFLGLTAWRAEVATREMRQHVTREQAVFSHPQRCEVSAVITTQPTVRENTVGYTARALMATCECSRSDAAAPTGAGELPADVCHSASLPPGVGMRLYGGPLDLARGDRVDATVEVSVVQLFRNHDLPDPIWTAARNGVTLSGGVLRLERTEAALGPRAWIDRARAHVRTRIERTYSPAAVALAKALVLGENDLDAEDDTAFKLSGLSHLLAVSGTHLVIAIGSLVAALRYILVRTSLAARFDVGRIATALGVPIALLYADFAGGSGSAWRAAWMLTVTYIFRSLDWEASARRALALSVVIGALIDPLVIFDISFQLSLAATLGLMTLGRVFSRPVDAIAHRGLRLFCGSVTTTIAAMLPCSVVLSLLSARISLAGIVANAVAAPFGEVIALPVCLAHAVVSKLPALERGLALVGSGALVVVRRVALLSAQAQAFSFPVPRPNVWHYFWIALLLAAWVGLARQCQRQNRLRVIAVLGAIIGLIGTEYATYRAGNPQGVLRVTMLDVGQGDSSLVDLPDGSLMLIDGGGFVGSPVDPGARVILPILRARRRSRIDVVVLSHPHPDHFGGLTSVFEQVPVTEFWDTGQGERFGAGPIYGGLLQLARARGALIRRPEEVCGTRQFGGAQIEVLAPCPDVVAGRDANDNSYVSLIRYKAHSALFVGDAEATEEAELLRRYGKKLHVDLLKVGHHGSRTSSSVPFLASVAPHFAGVSCGMRNRFGHPHSEAMLRLAQQVPVLARTDRSGSFEWATDGEQSIMTVQGRLFTQLSGAVEATGERR